MTRIAIFLFVASIAVRAAAHDFWI